MPLPIQDSFSKQISMRKHNLHILKQVITHIDIDKEMLAMLLQKYIWLTKEPSINAHEKLCLKLNNILSLLKMSVESFDKVDYNIINHNKKIDE